MVGGRVEEVRKGFASAAQGTHSMYTMILTVCRSYSTTCAREKKIEIR
jgi:hypothetical protein